MFSSVRALSKVCCTGPFFLINLFYVSGKLKLKPHPGENTPWILYICVQLLVSNVRGVCSPNTTKKTQTSPQVGHIWKQWLYFYAKLGQVAAGTVVPLPSPPLHCRRGRTWSQHCCGVQQKERMPVTQKVSSTRREMPGTGTITFFGQMGSDVTQGSWHHSSLLSPVWHVSVHWHTVTFAPSAPRVF